MEKGKPTEALLEAWLHLSTTLDRIQLSGDLTHNESLVCLTLYRQLKQNPDRRLTPTQIAQRTKIRKSQVNRTLNKLEARGMVTREHSTTDRREIYVHMDLDHAPEFRREYDEILHLVNQVCDLLGSSECEQLVHDMDRVSKLAEKSFPLEGE